jgi:hypothetical protein
MPKAKPKSSKDRGKILDELIKKRPRAKAMIVYEDKKTAKPPRSKKEHPADVDDKAHIAKAVSFNAFMQLGRTKIRGKDRKTLAEAVADADELRAEHKGRDCMVYAVTKDKQTIHVPKAMQDAARKGDAPRTQTPHDIATDKIIELAAKGAKRDQMERAAERAGVDALEVPGFVNRVLIEAQREGKGMKIDKDTLLKATKRELSDIATKAKGSFPDLPESLRRKDKSPPLNRRDPDEHPGARLKMPKTPVVSKEKRQEAAVDKDSGFRTGSKRQQVVALAMRPEGVSLKEVIKLLGWNPSNARRAAPVYCEQAGHAGVWDDGEGDTRRFYADRKVAPKSKTPAKEEDAPRKRAAAKEPEKRNGNGHKNGNGNGSKKAAPAKKNAKKSAPPAAAKRSRRDAAKRSAPVKGRTAKAKAKGRRR